MGVSETSYDGHILTDIRRNPLPATRGVEHARFTRAPLTVSRSPQTVETTTRVESSPSDSAQVTSREASINFRFTDFVTYCATLPGRNDYLYTTGASLYHGHWKPLFILGTVVSTSIVILTVQQLGSMFEVAEEIYSLILQPESYSVMGPHMIRFRRTKQRRHVTEQWVNNNAHFRVGLINKLNNEMTPNTVPLC